MAKDFDAAWDTYMDAYNACHPEDFISELQTELDTRMEQAAKFKIKIRNFEAGRCRKFSSARFLRSEVMSLARTKSKQRAQNKITWKIKRQKVLLFWAAIIVAYGVIFYYLRLLAGQWHFKNYKPKLGILHSEFVGLEKFGHCSRI